MFDGWKVLSFLSGQCPQKLLTNFFHWRFERWEPALCVFVGRPQEEKQKPGHENDEQLSPFKRSHLARG